MEDSIRIHKDDNVAVALHELKKGDCVFASGFKIAASETIPAGHKIALAEIPQGAPVIKYRFPIGSASVPIAQGAWVHTHNVKSRLGNLLEYRYQPDFKELAKMPAAPFLGYRRENGRVGIRNEVWIIPTVGCVNAVAKQIEDHVQKFLSPEIDGIFSYSHPYGCSQLGDDQRNTQKILCGLINHPNAAGVLVLGLGCENNSIAEMKKVLGNYNADRVKFLICQDCVDEVEAGTKLVGELCRYAREFRREPFGANELVVGLKCGGSDGFSGITANAVTGAFSDLLVSQGGTTLLTEVPEMFGAEQILMQRCRNEEVFEKTVSLINGFKSYFKRYGQKVDENPSPGNKAGGITTLEDKSLGCVQKAGSAPVEDVLDYGERVERHGLNLLQGPGNDLVAACALAASGANLILFTTGRGTPFGCPVPTVKIASNSALAAHKSHWIDFDAGRLLSGESLPALSQELFELVLSIAAGTVRTKSEALDKRELAIFKDGVTL
ncbi:UxaA family hydrolase [Caproiciproducens galactitolivorans]|uniref:UxaA family hydrolase n=1 Tax=Caproiciproducens galactitolivorans TaxID=642589 RepID=UPI0024090A75|nr:altronate dehydratase family protein [Caproiciproducens galactitolivorans]